MSPGLYIYAIEMQTYIFRILIPVFWILIKLPVQLFAYGQGQFLQGIGLAHQV